MQTFYMTDAGKVRTHNEDSVIIVGNKNNEFILAVADGMGGHKAGEIASNIAIEHIVQSFESMETIGKNQETIRRIFVTKNGEIVGCTFVESDYADSLEEMENVYWTFYALWKHGFFHPYLCGSVIEMLRISELKTLMRNFIIPALEKSSQNPEMTLKIKSTWELEKKIEQQAKAVKELRDSLVRRYYLSM